MPKLITDDERRRRLAVRHRLAPGTNTGDVAAIADSVVALHSTDPVSVFLSASARMPAPSIESVETALYDDRSLIRHHAMRRTLWVMTPEITRTAHAATTREIAIRERRRLISWLQDTPSVHDPERWLADATARAIAAIDRRGSATTREVGLELPNITIPISVAAGARSSTTVPGHSRVLLQAGFEGRIVRTRPVGSWISGQYLWSTAEGWSMPDLAGFEPAAGRGHLVRAWLERFGPGTETDLAWWTGLPVTKVRRALSDIDAQPVQLESGQSAWVANGDLAPTDDVGPWVALLPALDPTTMGWKERSWYLPSEWPRLFDTNGNAGPVIWARGRVIGGWCQRSDGDIAVEMYSKPDRTVQRLIDEEISRIKEIVGDTRFKPRFPPANQQELLSG